MRAEVVTIGSELLLGQILDSNAAFIARQLAAIGLDLHFKTTVGDNLGRLVDVLTLALSRSDVVITTGGIGPTADDVTREAVGQATGCPLEFSPALMEGIEAFFRARGLGPSPSNQKQAYIPRGALPIPNPVGTAPGFIVHVGARAVVTLPGVPREMEHLLTTQVIPYLRDRYHLSGLIQSRILRVCGLGESRVGETLKDFMETGSNPTVGTMAHLGQVDVRIAAKGRTAEEAWALIAPVEQEIRRRLGDLIFGVDHETLEGIVVARLLERNWRLGSIEVGGGELLSARIQDAPGGPVVYRGGLIMPSLEGRLPHPLEGGASEASAKELAALVKEWFQVEVGVSVVISVVPSEGNESAVLARVSVITPDQSTEKEFNFGAGSAQARRRAATMSLDLIRRMI